MRNHKIKNIILLSLFALAVLLVYCIATFPGYLGPGDNTTYANIARNIVQGNGIAHNTASIPQIMALNGFPEKDFDQPIGWPIVISFFMLFFGTSSVVPIIASSFFHIFNVLLLFILAKKTFNDNTAILSCIIYSLCLPLVSVASLGLTEPFFITLLLVIFLLSNKLEYPINFFWVGIIFGISFYIRVSGIFYILGYIVFIIIYFLHKREGYFLKSILFILGLIISILPFVIRYVFLKSKGWDMLPNHYIIYTLLGEEGVNSFLRSINFDSLQNLSNISLIEFIYKNIGIYFYNFMKNMILYLRYSFSDLSIPFILSLSFIYLLKKREKNSLKWFNILFIIFLVSNISLISFLHTYVSRYLIPFLPILIIFASYELINIYKNYKFKSKNKINKLIILTSILLLVTIQTPTQIINSFINKDNSIIYYQNFRDKIHKYFSEDDILISNNNSILGWNGDVKAVCFPHNIEEILILDSLYSDVSGIYLDSEGMKRWNISEDDEWMEVLKVPPPTLIGNFELVENISTDNFKSVLYIKND